MEKEMKKGLMNIVSDIRNQKLSSATKNLKEVIDTKQQNRIKNIKI